MKALKPVNQKRGNKQSREKKVLLLLVEHFIQTGRPVGSNTLKEVGIKDLSSATIRNYFVNLEAEGFLVQVHTSGGRVPTSLAYKVYAEACLEENTDTFLEKDPFTSIKDFDSKEMTLFLQEAAEDLVRVCRCAVFLSAPRFDRDFVADIKLVSLDPKRCLAVLISDFGVVRTEILSLPERLSASAIKRLECYFQWRLNGVGDRESLEPMEEALGQNFYNELMLRYIVGYTHFSHEDLYRTGFSQLLHHADFAETVSLTSALSLFEDIPKMRHLLKESVVQNKLKFWIGDDLNSEMKAPANCSVLAIPYTIHRSIVGAVGLIGPQRLPYDSLFKTLRTFERALSESLTRSVYKFKISYRMPQKERLSLSNEEMDLACGHERILLT